MAYINGNDAFSTPITRYYVDIRPHAPVNATRQLTPLRKEEDKLPLLHTLPKETQDVITKYVRKPDRFMSLASALLKHLFIHRTAKIPWSKVKVERTPKPHSRPYWAPPNDWSGKGFEGLEFNVSHQAGMVVLVGCKTPKRTRDARIDYRHDVSIRSPSVINPDPTAVLEADSWIHDDEREDVRIGVDIACTWEPPRTPDLSTQKQLEEWVDIFEEMFSKKEQNDMKYLPVPSPVPSPADIKDADQKTRRFYTYWALKEAYIKMVGEGLLAPWLRELEFRDVPVPTRAKVDEQHMWTILPDQQINRLGVLFKNRNIAHTMHTSLEAFQDTFLVATMTRGVVDHPESDPRWTEIDLFGAIQSCATGNCRCLE
ncbi:hypothetical protein LTR70_003732 [Exophiala xenobiotica]|uniref:holo-[acyl-carrier-protein] synthase n=1 Tax=Lithohypha guttulata TaxID=1690604 RepID=A0ABR0KI34_9EURO|nr:hypothetical protein LTR24_002308 [Lithohypha guttulata]KAK5322784.1 hypothetical protein LTR70_003732 [Exophiala xenobiotica]